MATALWRAACSGRQGLFNIRRMSTAGPPVLKTETPKPMMMNQENVQGNAGELDTNLQKIDGKVDSGSNSYIHLRLKYLNPGSKTPPSFVQSGDLRTGRIRPDPVYVPLSEHVFGLEPRRDLLHAAVVYYLDGRRAGTASTKTRGEVAFSGAKIRPQKGSGRARLGTRSNPLLRKGGVIFGPRPRDMSSKLNRRVRELALRSALSSKWKQGLLHVVKDLSWHSPPSTGLLRKLLQSKGWEDSLFLTAPRNPEYSKPTILKPNPKPSSWDPIYTKDQEDEHKKSTHWIQVALACNARVTIINLNQLPLYEERAGAKPAPPNTPSELHAYHLLRRQNVILDLGAVEWLEQKLGGTIFQEEEMEEIYKEIDENITNAKLDEEKIYVSHTHMAESYDIIKKVEGKKLPREDEFRH